MSDKKIKFSSEVEVKKVPEASEQNPKSVDVLHNSQIKPKSQDNEIPIIIKDETKDNTPKSIKLIQKGGIELKRRVTPGLSKIIIRKNKEKREKEEAKKLKEEAAKLKQEAQETTEKLKEEVDKTREKVTEQLKQDSEKTETKKEQQKETKKEQIHKTK